MILIAFGSNLSFGKQSPRTIVIGALGALNQFVDVTAVSKLYVSTSWPDPSQPDYINGVAAISTGLAPEVLLAGLHALEASFGRQRAEMNARALWISICWPIKTESEAAASVMVEVKRAVTG